MKVTPRTDQLLGVERSSQQVTRVAQQLDAALERWRERPLDAIRYLYLGAHYEKVHQEGQVLAADLPPLDPADLPPPDLADLTVRSAAASPRQPTEHPVPDVRRRDRRR